MKHVQNFIEFNLFEGIKQGAKGDPYEYKEESGKYYTRKKGAPNWTLAKGTSAKAIQDKIFSVASVAAKSNKTSTENKLQSAQKMKQIGTKINQVKQAQPSVLDYLKNAIGRKYIPNVIQLFDAKPLTSNDFTDDQKKVILQVIENSKKRNSQSATKTSTGRLFSPVIKAGAVNYDDFGKDVASAFKNERGSPSMWDIAWSTLKLDQFFALATLLGQFSWKQLPNGHYQIEDKYDFKDPGYKELTGVNRESLEGLGIAQLQKKFKFNSYEAARVKGWVDYPDSIPSKALDVNIVIDPKALA